MADVIPVGYQELIERFDLRVVPHYRASYVSQKGQRKMLKESSGQEKHIYSKSYAPGDAPLSHLEFALKYDGINLGILKAVFDKTGAEPIRKFVSSNPAGRYARKIWYLYEFLTGDALDLPNIEAGNYIELLNPDAYFTITPGRSRRHRILDNLLGDNNYCPTVRKTAFLAQYASKDLSSAAKKITEQFPIDVIQRASRFLFTKETLTSYNIERERPDIRKANRFIALLRSSRFSGDIDKKFLIDLQNMIADERFADKDYRHTQNYVGQNIGYRQRIHYISPKPGDVPALMNGLLNSVKRMDGNLDPVIEAAAISFGFVFIHPFEDGNGRIHRYLIHHVLSKNNFTPEGLIIPVSATMLANQKEYDACLEEFSQKVMPNMDYVIDDRGRLTVKNDSADFYRFPDMTPMAEYLYDVVEKTINKDFREELVFVMNYNKTVERMKETVDMPDKLINLFIKLSMQSPQGISKSKRKSFFKMLTDEEIDKLERICSSLLKDNKITENKSTSGIKTSTTQKR